MAYLDRTWLTCSCGATGRVIWVVGSGPSTRPGDGPAYVSLKDTGPWIAETETRHPFWQGRLICPDCGAEVLSKPGEGPTL